MNGSSYLFELMITISPSTVIELVQKVKEQGEKELGCAIIARLEGNYKKSKEILSELSNKSNNKLIRAFANLELSFVQWKLDDFEGAHKTLQKVNFHEFETKWNKLIQAKYHHYYGNIIATQGEIRRSLENHLQALKLYEDIGTHDMKSRILNNLGYSFSLLGDLQKGLDYLQNAIEITPKDNYIEIARTMVNLGQIHRYHGKFNEAKVYFLDALSLQLASMNPAEFGFTVFELGKLYYEMGDVLRLKAMKKILFEALKMQRTSDNEGRALFLEALEYISSNNEKDIVQGWNILTSIIPTAEALFSQQLCLYYLGESKLRYLKLNPEANHLVFEIERIIYDLRMFGKKNSSSVDLLRASILAANLKVHQGYLASAETELVDAKAIIEKLYFPQLGKVLDTIAKQLRNSKSKTTEKVHIVQLDWFWKVLSHRIADQNPNNEKPILFLLLSKDKVDILYQSDGVEINLIELQERLLAFGKLLSQKGELIQISEFEHFNLLSKHVKNKQVVMVSSGNALMSKSRFEFILSLIEPQLVDIPNIENIKKTIEPMFHTFF